MPQAIMATTAMTKPADSQHMKDRSRSDIPRGYASAAALQLGREIDPRCLRPLPFFRLALITPADPSRNATAATISAAIPQSTTAMIPPPWHADLTSYSRLNCGTVASGHRPTLPGEIDGAGDVTVQ